MKNSSTLKYWENSTSCIPKGFSVGGLALCHLFFSVSRHVGEQRHLVRKRNFLSKEWKYRNLGRDDELERSWDREHSSVLSRLNDIERLSCHLSSMMLTGCKDEIPERSRKRSQIFLVWLLVPSKPTPLIAITLLLTWHFSHYQLPGYNYWLACYLTFIKVTQCDSHSIKQLATVTFIDIHLKYSREIKMLPL